MSKPIKESFSTKAFIKVVNDEYDIETLQMMQALIDKRITFLNKMVDTVNPRKVVKGYRRENVNEDYAKDMQKEFEKKSKYDYSTVLNAVRSIKDKFGWSAISNSHRLMNEIEKILPGVSEYLWDIQIGPIRNSYSHGKFSELFVNKKAIGNVFVNKI